MNQFIFPNESSMKSGFPWAGDEAELPEAVDDETFSAAPDFHRIREILTEAMEPEEGITDASARRVEIPVHPDEEIDPRQGAADVWSYLRAWADYHRVDTDQALLVCACAAAHAAGSSLDFENEGCRRLSAPTLIAASEDRGSHKAVLCALRPLRQIQQELVGRYGGMADALASVKADRSIEDICWMLARATRQMYDIYHDTPAGRLDPEEQPEGAVRFLLEGAPPAKPHKFLEGYHLHTVVARLEIERLPQTARAREKRLEAIVSMVNGFRNGTVWIRGYIRFSRKDLEWVLGSTRHLRVTSLPVGGAERAKPDGAARDEGGKLRFDRIHGVALREVLRQRFGREMPVPGAEFRDGEAAGHFRLLREAYRREMPSVNHLAPMCAVLPDLFVWYLLRLVKSRHVKADEMEVAEHAIAAARTIRRKVAGIYDWHDALGIGHKRQALALKLVNRMQRLGGFCKRRELARGLDNQRMDVIAPMIDLLIRHGVFSSEAGGLSMSAQSAFEEIGLEAFMPALEEVPHSGTRRLKIAEQRHAFGEASGDPAQGLE